MKETKSIAICTLGRFHLADLARELDRQGFDVSFYSAAPPWQLKELRLRPSCIKALFWMMLPIFLISRLLAKLDGNLAKRVEVFALNTILKMRMSRCDLFIGISGITLEAAKFARKKYSAKIWIERGSRHIVSQDKILSSSQLGSRPSTNDLRRELQCYSIADKVVVPSTHVEQSFVENGYPIERMIRIPYGTDTRVFSPRTLPTKATEQVKLVMTGAWCFRKGADLVEKVLRRSRNYSLTHVGPVLDYPLPRDLQNFRHFDTVPQNKLAEFYHNADAMLLASREEGLAVVQVQALACGCPIICSAFSGGTDLGHTPSLTQHIFEIDPLDELGIENALQKFSDSLNGGSLPQLSAHDLSSLDWIEYGIAYAKEIRRGSSK